MPLPLCRSATSSCGKVSGQRTIITIGPGIALPAPFLCGITSRVLPGLVLGDRLFQIFQQLIGAQLLRAATKPMAEQAVDQHSKFVVFDVQFAMLVRRRGHHISSIC
jgi:hypothetical protein